MIKVFPSLDIVIVGIRKVEVLGLLKIDFYPYKYMHKVGQIYYLWLNPLFDEV